MNDFQDIEDRFKRNVNMIPWTSQIKTQQNIAMENARKMVESGLRTGSNLLESVLKGVTGSQQELTSSRAVVQQGITSAQNNASQTAARIAQILIDPIQTNIDSVKAQITQEKESQSKSDAVYKIRKEQTAALTDKYASNLHSSWLGLYRPLQDQSRAILATAAVVLGLLTVVIAIYFSFGAVSGLIAGRGGGGVKTPVISDVSSLTNYVNNIGTETIRNFVGGVRSRK